MHNDFSYKVNTIPKGNIKRYETFISIEYLGKSTEFNSGLYCTTLTYKNHERNSLSLDPVFYGFEKGYSFAREWIELVLYKYYIQSLIVPDVSLVYKAEKKISEDMGLLNSLKSYTYSLQTFLLDRFRNLNEEVPKYSDFALFHRLLDSVIDHQLRTESLLHRDSINKKEFYLNSCNYSVGPYCYNLSQQLKELLKWSFECNIGLLNTDDFIWIIDI